MAISRETIERKHLLYSIIKPYVDFVTKLYFRTTSINYRKIPKDDIVIFTPNHQNALMDALAILAVVKTEPVFLARADIFKKKTVEKILTFLKILPIYRIRDGKENLKNNDVIFQKTVDVLKNKNGLVILPEGNHAGRRNLRTLKKGISRIAFEAEESNDFKLNIKIIPVGLDWSNYSNFRSKLMVYFGEPIYVSDFYEAYQENAPRAMNMLREKLSFELKKYMIHIENEAYYEMFDTIRYVYLPQMIQKMGFKNMKQPNQLFAQQNIIKQLDWFVESSSAKAVILNDITRKYSDLLKKLNFRHWVIQKGKFSTLSILVQIILSIFFLPLFLYGGILNVLPFNIPVWATRKVKDPQFLSSFREVIALLVFPIYYIILISLASIYIDQWWLLILFGISMPFVGFFAFQYYIQFKKMIARIRFNVKLIFKNKSLLELIENYHYIIQTLNSIQTKKGE